MIQHLLELRRIAVRTLLCFFVLLLLCFYFSDELFRFLVMPLLHSLPKQEGLIATQITAPVFTPIKLAANAALLLSAPFALVQLWRFASPGLYRKEQRFLRTGLVASLFLFSAGVLFCFYLVLPFMFQFFTHSLPKGVRFMPDMVYTIDFITWMLLVFGLSFQVPLVCALLVRLNLVNVATLKKIRPYVIVAAFIIGMLLTPPDVLSQILLAVPLCSLYELGIILCIQTQQQ